MARSGGTLISRCIGCMNGVALLSEIHPKGLHVHNPLQQAHDWFQLFSDDDIKAISTQTFSYLDAISLINKRIIATGKTLVIRDWSHMDFTGLPFINNPSYKSMNDKFLKTRFSLISTATVRHPIDQWLSLSKLTILKDHPDLTIKGFMLGYLEFARYAKQIGFIRYEDFILGNHTTIKNLCSNLKLKFDGDYINKWHRYNSITGDNATTSASRFINHTTIESSPIRAVDEAVLDQFHGLSEYAESTSLLGYKNYR